MAIERDHYLTVSSGTPDAAKRFVTELCGTDPRRILRVDDQGPDPRREGRRVFHVYVLRSTDEGDVTGACSGVSDHAR